jgi:serralysin
VRKSILTLLLATPLLVYGQTRQNLTETPKPADLLVDSMGVNVHMTYGDTAYGNIAAVRTMLQTLGLRHVRDGGKYLSDSAYNQYEFGAYGNVSSLGIGFDLILTFEAGMDPNPMTEANLSALRVLAATNSVTIESLEGPNEIDIQGDKNWVFDTRSFMQSVSSASSETTSFPKVPLLGPSLAGASNDWVLLGNLTANENVGNIHPYANTQYPSYNFALNLANERNVSGSQTIYVTESGWSNAMKATDGSPNVTEQVAGRYVGRLFLETLLWNWPRTYVYELVDEQNDPGLTNTQHHFGLFRYDYSAKPAATVIQNMVALMSDKGYSFTPHALSYSLSTPSSAVHHLLFQKHDGSYWLALWQEVSDWNGWNAQGSAITNPDVALTLTLPGIASTIETYEPLNSASPLESVSNQQTVTLMVPDHPLLVKIVLVAAPQNLHVTVK